MKHRLTVQGIKRATPWRFDKPESRRDVCRLVRLGVRDRDALADSRRTQLLALEQEYPARGFSVFYFAGFHQRAHQLFQHGALIRRGREVHGEPPKGSREIQLILSFSHFSFLIDQHTAS